MGAKVYIEGNVFHAEQEGDFEDFIALYTAFTAFLADNLEDKYDIVTLSSDAVVGALKILDNDSFKNVDTFTNLELN